MKMMPLTLTLNLLFFFLTLGALCSAETHSSITTPSGRTIPLSALHSHIRSAQQAHIPHLLFELVDNKLLSKYSSVYVPPASSADRVTAPPIQRSHNGIRLPDSSSSPLIRQTKLGYTFIFESSPDLYSPSASHFTNYSNPLLAVWGPSLMLHPLDSVNYPGVYLNAAGYRAGRFNPRNVTVSQRHIEDSIASTTRSDAIVLGSCNRYYAFELGIVHDASFCRMFDGSRKKAEDAIRGLVYNVSSVFRDSVCVQLQILSLDSFCGDENDFSVPPGLHSCVDNAKNSSVGNGKCDKAKSLLDLISREWQKGVSAGAFRDAGFFFSGYEDQTDLAGATYRAQACNERLSFAWVERGIAPVFAHEVCHMLGAQHDTSGVMTPTVNEHQAIILSNNTRVKIRRFVELDSRAWCLRRSLQAFPWIQRQYKWNTLHSLLTDYENNANVSDATFAQAFADNQTSTSTNSTIENDLVYVLTRPVASNGLISVNYSIARGMECDKNSRCRIPSKYQEFPIKEHEVPLNFTPGSFAFSIAFARLASAKSRDFIFMHVRPYRDRQGILRQRPFYRVGLGIGNDGSPPPSENWSSEEHTIQNFGTEDIQCASISAVSLIPNATKGLKKTDLLYVHIDKKKNRNILQYWIGMDLSPSGKVQGGWTEAIDVPGWFGRETTAVSGAMLDIDGNGLPELILYHVDNTVTIKSGFVRIGRDMNSTGHVTNGWSDFIQSPNLNQYVTFFRNSGTMAVHPRMGGNQYPIVAAIQRQGFFDSWDLTVGASVLTPKTLKTSRFRGGIEDLTLGCDECYSFKYTEQCKKDLDRCKSTIDEVRMTTGDVENGYLGGSKLSWDGRIGSGVLRKYEDTYIDGEVQNDPSRPNSTISDSMFCAGFHYLYKNRTGCDVVDRATVIAKGVEVAFREAIEGADPEAADEIDSTSLFESPAGPHGNGNPVAAQFVIYSKKSSYEKVLRRVFEMLRKRKGFGVFVDPDTKLKTHVQNIGKKWIVRLYFKEKHLREYKEV